jgi:hypothetical protein
VETTENITVISDEVAYWQIILAMIVAAMGMIGNSIITVMFLKKKNHVNFHRLMILLSIYDNISIIMNLSLFIIPNIIKSDENIHQIIEKENLFIPYGYPVLEIALTGSIYFTLAISIERYLIVCHPFYAISRDWPFNTYIIIISVFCLVYNLPRFYELQTLQCQNGEMDTSDVCNNDTSLWRKSFINENHNCSLRNTMLTFTDLGCSRKYFVIYRIVLDSILRCITPFLLLIIMNSLIIKNLHEKHPSVGLLDKSKFCVTCFGEADDRCSVLKRKRHLITETQREDIKLAITSMLMATIFIMCNSVIWIPRLYEYINRSETDICKMKKGILLGYFFTTLNSSIKCYAYFFLRYDPLLYLKSIFNLSKKRFSNLYSS